MSQTQTHFHDLSYLLKKDGRYFVGRVRELPPVFEQSTSTKALERKLKNGILNYLVVCENVHKTILKSSKPKILLTRSRFGKEGKIIGVRKLKVRCR